MHSFYSSFPEVDKTGKAPEETFPQNNSSGDAEVPGSTGSYERLERFDLVPEVDRDPPRPLTGSDEEMTVRYCFEIVLWFVCT